VIQKVMFSLMAISLGAVLFGCSKEDKPAQATPAPTPTQQVAEVVKIDPAVSAEGEQLYNQNCVVCHQADAIGKPGFAPSLTNQEFLSIVSDKFLLATIRDGRQGTAMPPFAHLGRAKIELIVAFLKSHATQPNVATKVDAQPVTQGDPRLGQFWFEQICATCHGPNGDGYAAGGTGTAIGMAGFLDKASDGFIRETIRQGRSNTRMIGYGGPASMADLSSKEIDDIISYLRTVPGKS